ncbi:MAG: ribosome small subunit-dependent GTPase A [Clostridium sp.]|nr:ribosome small subunit-dependent GTPase A [Clostridium sp.]
MTDQANDVSLTDRLRGKITKGIAGFYYVDTVRGTYECKAKGLFRKEQTRPLVGDNVELEIIDEGEKTGVISYIAPRQNELIRPRVANVDQIAVVMSLRDPMPSLNLLDRVLFHASLCEIPCLILFNKVDLASPSKQTGRLETDRRTVDEANKQATLHEADQQTMLYKAYQQTAIDVLFISAKLGQEIDVISRYFTGKTTVLSGPSGVGKSTLVNALQPEVLMETGSISAKIGRGKHTTRHTQMIKLSENSYLLDTPGFSSYDMLPEQNHARDWEAFRLADHYPEFQPFEGQCRFQPCKHRNEPDCAVKQAVTDGQIDNNRYQNYCLLEEEMTKSIKVMYTKGMTNK